MKDKFIVKTYYCKPNEMQTDMNEKFNDGYYPKEIKLGMYQDEVEASIIYELQEV